MLDGILVVDDDPVVLSAIVALLRYAGHHVTGAATFQDGMRLLDQEPPKLLIVDVRLGAFNGLHLLVHGRIEHPGMAAIVTTGFSDPVLAAEAIRYGAEFVMKPVDPSDLLSQVARLLASTGAALPSEGA